jgi:hypothetical protein
MTARNTGAPPVPARALARHRACVRSDARRPNPASSEDGTSSHGSVAARPIEQQRETQGRPPFLRARSRYATCMSAGLRVRGDARMLAPAKPHIRRGWDLVSRIGCSKSHQMAVRKLGALSISASALALHHTCSECRASAAMRGCSPRPKHASGENGTWSHGLVASRPIEWQQESSGRSPFPRARLLCNVHVRSGCNSQIRVVMLEDLAVFCNEFIHVSHSILMLCKVQQI